MAVSFIGGGNLSTRRKPSTSGNFICNAHLFDVLFLILKKRYKNDSCYTGARGTDHPPFSNFLFTNLFSIKFLYFFIISSLFPYFNLFVSIFIQSYVNIKLHVSTLLDAIIVSNRVMACVDPIRY